MGLDRVRGCAEMYHFPSYVNDYFQGWPSVVLWIQPETKKSAQIPYILLSGFALRFRGFGSNVWLSQTPAARINEFRGSHDCL